MSVKPLMSKARIVPAALAAFLLVLFAPALAQTGNLTVEKTIAEVFGDQPPGGDIPVTDFAFEIYVPADYDESVPAGLLVFISPAISGKAPPRLNRVFDEKNLIWISVNASGNKHETGKRIIEAIASLHFASSVYAIDPTRLYLSGFSGGGRVASIVAQYYPDYFNGFIYFAGVDPWRGARPDNIEAMKHSRYVFLTGGRDFNRTETRRAYREYERAGFEKIKLMDIRGLGHRMPEADDLGKAIDFLDAGAGD